MKVKGRASTSPCVHSYKRFYRKTGTWVVAEQLLPQLAAVTHSYRQFLPTPCFVNWVDAKAPVFRDGSPVPSILCTNSTESISTEPLLCWAGAPTSFQGAKSEVSTYGLWRRIKGGVRLATAFRAIGNLIEKERYRERTELVQHSSKSTHHWNVATSSKSGMVWLYCPMGVRCIFSSPIMNTTVPVTATASEGEGKDLCL